MSERARRAGSYGRAPADPLLEELSSHTAELAKRWAIALIEGAAPEEIAAVDLALIASEGPGVLETVLDAAARAEGGMGGSEAVAAANIAALVGAGTASELALALEALRSVLWEAAVEAFPRARTDARAARRLLEAGDALAAACSALLSAELDALGPPADVDAPGAGAADAGPAFGAGARAAAATPLGAPVVIVDERRGALPGVEAGGVRAERANATEAPAFEPAISARDARGTQDARAADAAATRGPAAWIDSIGAQLAAAGEDRRSFAVMLVELLEPFAPPGTGRRTPPLEGVLDDRLRERDGLSLTQERAGRYWLVLPDSDRAGAESLRDWLADALSSGRGVAAVAIGVAVFPEDAADAAGLAAQADLDLYASRSHSALYGRRIGHS